jgi:hypothetical protein
MGMIVSLLASKLRALSGAGLGDVAKAAIRAVGVKKSEDCGGCDKRRKALNRFKLPK